jgi:predicted permease
MRLSLGASRMRIVRQLLTESALLGLGAGTLAFLLSWALLQAAVVLVADAFPDQYGTFVFHVAPDLSIFAFVALISLSAGFLFGLAPALESSRSAAATALKANAATSPARGRRMRHLLIGTQVAVAAVLVIAGSLLIHSALRAASMETGYDDQHTISLNLAFPGTAAYTPEHKEVLVRELRARIEALPGVVDVTSGRAPDDGSGSWAAVATNGEAPSPQNVKTYVYYQWVESNYFTTLGIPLVEGRGMTAQSGQPEPSIILSEAAARQIFPGENPLGRTLRLGVNGFYQQQNRQLPDGPVWRVIGVARDTRGVIMDGSDTALAYLPLAPDHVPEHPILIHTVGDPQQTINALAAVVTGVDGNLAGQAQTLEAMLRQTAPFLLSSMAAAVAMTTGLLGLLLATVGIYGTVSYMVVLRTREVGIRMALGATKSDVLALIVRESARPVIAGLGAGIVLGAGVAYLLRGLLYGIHTFDPVSFGGVSVLFLAVALLASVIPSRRAMRIEPLTALRYE